MNNLFLSVGAMKAGTTWMYQVLSHHPDIYFTPEKEIHYFAHAYVSDENPLNPTARLMRAKAHAGIDPERNHPAGVRRRLLWTANYLSEPIDDIWYRNLFAFRRQQTWCADFSNLYAHIEPAGWERIRAQADRLRVIYTMRDPIKRLWSHMKFHMQFVGKADAVASITPGWTQEFLMKRFMWKHAEYGDVVRRLNRSLDQAETRFYFYEDVHADPIGWLQDVERFLDVPTFEYSEERVHRRINESMSASMPMWFPELFRDEVDRIIDELTREGLSPPESWAAQRGGERLSA